MTVAELIKQLETLKQDSPIYFVSSANDDGDSCGYGATQIEDDPKIVDLETKIHLIRD